MDQNTIQNRIDHKIAILSRRRPDVGELLPDPVKYMGGTITARWDVAGLYGNVQNGASIIWRWEPGPKSACQATENPSPAPRRRPI